MRRPRIFYLGYDHNNPTGGQKHTYQHVDVLNRHGFDASVVHVAPGFRVTWFENDTRVTSYADFLARHDEDRDFLVVAEDIGDHVDQLPGRKVVFNKGIFRGFAGFGLRPPRIDPYLRPDVVAALVVSAHNAGQLRYAYPHLDVHEVTMDLRADAFPFRPLREKARQVATVDKGPQGAAAYQIFRARADAGLVPGGPREWVVIQDASEAEVADVLGRSLVFVFQSVEEGLGRMPLEALLAGCVVVAYAAGPLKGILPAELCCEYADPAGLSRLVEAVLARHPDRLSELQPVVLAGRQRALRYSAEEQERSVCDAWEKVFTRHEAEPRRLTGRGRR